MFLFLNQFCEYRIDFCIDTDGIGPIVLGIVLKSEIRVLPTTNREFSCTALRQCCGLGLC